MAKPKPNLAGLLDDLAAVRPTPKEQPKARSKRALSNAVIEETVLVGANLPPRYARNLALLHAETGRTKKELLQEALDMLFTAKGGVGLKM